jgi:tetratricopeptide (TPR) repeat protein
MNPAQQPAQPADENLTISEALAKAQAHWNVGQTDQAEMCCRRVLAVWPGQADALHLLGILAHAYGNLELALSYVREACEAPRAPALYACNLAEMCRQKGLLAEGEAAARRALGLSPDLPEAWNNLGIILQESGKYEESLECLERLLQLQPDNVEGFNNLGNTCMRLGRPEDAKRYWRQALALNPDYAQPHSNLAHLLSELGEYDLASEHAHRAIDLNPTLAEAYVNLAGISIARQRPDEGLRWLNTLLGFAPTHSGGLIAQAQLLQSRGRLEEALAAAGRALAAAPQNAEAHNAKGAVLQAMGRTEEALTAFGRAAALPGIAAEQASVNRTLLYMEQGAQIQTQAAFEQAIAQFPNSPTILYNYADFKTFERNDPIIARMEDLLEGARQPSIASRMMLHFALGKIYLDIGDSDRAFLHLGRGNKLKRNSFIYTAETATRLMQDIETTFSAALLEKLGGQGASSSKPIFVLGMPRSGTTLVEQILATHTEIFGAGELRHVQLLVDDLFGFPGLARLLQPAQLRRLGEAYLSRIGSLAPNAKHVVDKLPFNFAYAGLIRLILPDARIIHVRRNAVDTCLSCYSKLFTGEQKFAYDQTELGTFYRDYERLATHWRKILPATHYLEVAYESLVEDTERQARRMLDFLGLEWDPACLKFHLTQRAIRTASINQVRQPIHNRSAGRWRPYEQHLKPLLVALAEVPGWQSG